MAPSRFLVSPEEIRRMGDQVTAWVLDYFTHIREASVFPGIGGDLLHEQLQEPLPLEGQPWDAIMERFVSSIVANSRHNSHPRFYGYISGASTPASAFADALASAINQNLTAWRSAPAATEVERLVVDWMRQLLGLPDTWSGGLTSGGSLANWAALAVARCARFDGDVRNEGLQDIRGGRMVMYASSEAHGSISKAADLLGIGQRQVHAVPVFDDMTMDVSALAERIRSDRAQGERPFCVVASAGTVNTGAVDALAAIAEICGREGLWFHVDGAYGALAKLSSSAGELFAGIEQADSISMDPHKWLYVPMDAGCVLYREPLDARRTFSQDQDYMRVNLEPDTHEGYAFFDYSPELSRRFRALRIWVSLKYFGSRAVAAGIDANIRVARYLQERIAESSDFQLLAPGPLSIACFRYIPAELRMTGPAAGWTFGPQQQQRLNRLNDWLVLQLQNGGRFYPSGTKIRGCATIRVCIVNYLAEEHDMDALLTEIRELAREYSRIFA